MKTLRRKVKIGVKKYDTVINPLSVEEEKKLAEFFIEIKKHKERKKNPRIGIIERFTKTFWFPEAYKYLYESP